MAAKPDKYDPYREALVLETETDWSNVSDVPENRDALEQRLHASAGEASELYYIRLQTGFRRRIVVSDDDLKRLDS